MSDVLDTVKDAAGSKLGKFPVWVWGVGLGLIILVAYYFVSQRRKQNAAGSNSSGITVTSDDLLTGLAGSPQGGKADAGTVEPVETNSSWRQKGVSLLTSQGVSPLEAQMALDNYLLLGALTKAQATHVNTVIAANGLPPDGTFNIPSITPNANTFKGFYAKHPNGGTVWLGVELDDSGNIVKATPINRQASANAWALAHGTGKFALISYDEYRAKGGTT